MAALSITWRDCRRRERPKPDLPWYYWETTVINHRTGVEELSSRTDRTTPFTMDWPNVSFAT
jgi:hypothetical protein